MKKRGNAGKRKINWSAFTGWFVLLSLVAAMIYIIVVLVLAPSHTQIVFERTKSDYVLMLLQCALGIVAIIGPNILQKRHNFIIPSKMMVLYTLFLYGAIFLGEVMAFYYNVPHWDTFLHGLSGAMLGALGYTVISVLNKSDSVPVNLSPLFVAFFTFCFAMTMGMIWEIYEFAADGLFGMNMQKFMLADGTVLVGHAALADTMKDIIVDVLGSLLASVIGFFSIRKGKGWYIPTLTDTKEDPQ